MTDPDTVLRTVLLVIVALLALPLVMMALAVPFMGGMHTGVWGTGMSAGGWVWIALFPLLFLLLIGYVGYRLLASAGDVDSDAAIEELRVAYARGELTDEEYDARRQRLEADRNENE